MLKERVKLQERFSIEDCKKNPTHLYVFGDNLLEVGKGGQAIIRDCVNTHGVPTKRTPSTDKDAYFSDQPEEWIAMKKQLDALVDIHDQCIHLTLVFPTDGLGTGLSDMPKRSPKLFKKMNNFLKYHFGIEY